MKILLASTSSGSRGGGEIFLLYLGQALKRRGHEVMLWCSTHSRMDELAKMFQEYGKVYRNDYPNTYYERLGRSFSAFLDNGTAQAIASEWKKTAPDIVHLNKQNLEDGLDLVKAARLSGLPALGTIHLTQSMAELKAVLGSARDYIARKALKQWPGMWVAVGEKRKKMLSAFLDGGDGIECVENGVPVPEAEQLRKWRQEKREELKLTNDKKLIVAVGRLVKQKRPLFFLDIARHWLAEKEPVHFLWIGDGVMKEQWDASVRQWGLSPSVTQMTWKKDVSSYLAAADYYLHVADYEGLPLSLLEAMATGLPCGVSGNLMTELPFLNTENCWSISETEPFVSPEADVVSTIGQQARHMVERRFSADRMAEDYEILYKKTVEQAS